MVAFEVRRIPRIGGGSGALARLYGCSAPRSSGRPRLCPETSIDADTCLGWLLIHVRAGLPGGRPRCTAQAARYENAGVRYGWRYAAAGISPTEALAGTVPKEALLSLAAVANGVLPAPAGTGTTGIDWATTRARLGHTR